MNILFNLGGFSMQFLCIRQSPSTNVIVAGFYVVDQCTHNGDVGLRVGQNVLLLNAMRRDYLFVGHFGRFLETIAIVELAIYWLLDEIYYNLLVENWLKEFQV